MTKPTCIVCGKKYDDTGGHSCRCNPVRKDKEAMKDRDYPIDHKKTLDDRLRDGFEILRSSLQE